MTTTILTSQPLQLTKLSIVLYMTTTILTSQPLQLTKLSVVLYMITTILTSQPLQLTKLSVVLYMTTTILTSQPLQLTKLSIVLNHYSCPSSPLFPTYDPCLPFCVCVVCVSWTWCQGTPRVKHTKRPLTCYHGHPAGQFMLNTLASASWIAISLTKDRLLFLLFYTKDYTETNTVTSYP